jgi:hypothetical protein
MNNTKNTYNKPNMTNPLVAGMAAAANVAFTANGAKSNASSLDACVDFFGKGAAMRAQSDVAVIDLFSKSFYQDRLVALKTLFYIRDIREGQGCRREFRICMKWLAENYPDIFLKNIKNIPEFGRYDDLFCIFE